MKKWLVITTIFLGLAHSVKVQAQQEDSVRTQVQEQLEKAFEELEDEEGLVGEDLIQFLEDLAANPVNINSAGINEFLQIPGLNLKIASAVISYRNKKPFETKEELLKVREFVR